MNQEELAVDKNYTIAKFVGTPTEYGEGADKKTRFAFTTNELGGDYVVSLFTKFPEHIKPGATVWGHIEDQKKGDITYHNFFFGKNNPNKKGGMSEADRTSIALAVRQSSDAVTLVKKLRGDLISLGILKETTSDGNEMPDFAPKKEVDPELSSLEQSAEAAMR